MCPLMLLSGPRQDDSGRDMPTIPEDSCTRRVTARLSGIVERRLGAAWRSRLSGSPVVVLAGARGAGKSALLRQLAEDEILPAAAGATAAAAAGSRGRVARAAADGDRGEQSNRVVVALRAAARCGGVAHRAGQLEGVSAGTAPGLVSRHNASLPSDVRPQVDGAVPVKARSG